MSLTRNLPWYLRRLRTNPIHRVWSGMMRRCYLKSGKDYKFYGGRGIYVCKRWHSFERFAEDVWRDYSPGLSLDRRNNNHGYSPDNCRWIDHTGQCRNRRSTNLLTNPKTKETKSLTEWAQHYGISRNTITSRIRLGYTDFKVLTLKPIGKGRPKGRSLPDFAAEARQVVD